MIESAHQKHLTSVDTRRLAKRHRAKIVIIVEVTEDGDCYSSRLCADESRKNEVWWAADLVVRALGFETPGEPY